MAVSAADISQNHQTYPSVHRKLHPQILPSSLGFATLCERDVLGELCLLCLKKYGVQLGVALPKWRRRMRILNLGLSLEDHEVTKW